MGSSDNLTLKFKEELEKRGIYATPSEIDSFIAAQRAAPSQPPINLGGSLYENVSPSAGLGLSDMGGQQQQIDEQDFDYTKNILQGVGAGLWEFANTATFGIPGIGLQAIGVDPYKVALGEEELAPGGKVGKVFGQAAGFLQPIKAVGKVTSSLISRYGAKGGKRITTKIVDDLAEIAGGNENITAAGFKSTVLKEFRSEETAKQLTKYSLTPEFIASAKADLRSNIGNALTDAFPKARGSVVDDLTNAIVDNLGKEGRHINSAGQWVQRILGRRLGLDETKWVSKWATHSAEMTVNFGLYNTLVNGLQSMAGNEDFDPVGNFYHALTFSAFLPFVEGLPGGGKIPIFRTAKDVRNLFNVYKKTNYDSYSREALNGMLKVVAAKNSIKPSYTQIAADNAWRNLSHKQAKEQLMAIRKDVNLDKIWSEFASSAGKDLTKSIGRMVAGAMYFNASTLINEDVIRGVDPAEFGAHLLVGAFFTRMRKPTFEQQTPHLSDFQSKLELLRLHNIDAKGLEGWNSYLTNRQILAAANGGALGESRLNSVYDVIYNKTNQDLMKVEGDRLGSDIREPEFNLLLDAKEIADIRRVSEAVNNSEPENIVLLEHLPKERARELIERLKRIEINKETGERLTEENFDNFYVDMQRTLLEEGAQTIMRAVKLAANEVAVAVEGDINKWNLDTPSLRIENIAGSGSNYDKLGRDYGAISEYQALVRFLKAHNYIQDFVSTKPKSVDDIMKSESSAAVNSKVEGILRDMADRLRQDNFPDGFEIEISPTDPGNNAWLALMGRYRSQKDLHDAYDSATGRNAEMNESIANTLDPINPVTNKRGGMPSDNEMRVLVEISKEKPDSVKDESTWETMQADIVPRLHDKLIRIAKIYARGNRSPVQNKRVINYDDAKLLVGQFELSNKSIFREDFLDKYITYYNSREFKDRRLGRREAGIMDAAREFLVPNRVNNIWVFPDGEEVRETLYEEGYKEAEIQKKIKDYESIKTSLSRLTNKYIRFTDELKTDDYEKRGDLGGFIETAYQLTAERQSDIFKEYDRVVNKSTEQVKIIEEANDIISRLYDNEVEAMRKLSKDETLDVVSKIDKLLNRRNAKGEDAAFQDESLESYLKTLKDTMEKWANAADVVDSFTLGGKLHEGGIEIIEARASTYNKLRDTMQRLVNLNGSSLHRMRGAGRVKSELTASFIKQIKGLKIDITDESSLPEIYEKYNFEGDKGTNPRNIDNFIDQVNLKILTEQRNLSQEQYEAINEEIARNRDILSDNNTDVEKLNYNAISRRYSDYNENLSEDNIEGLRSAINESILKEYDKPSTELVSNITDLIRNVHEAIDSKNDNDLGKSIPEKAQFNKEFPGLLAKEFGSELIDVISFSENGFIKEKDNQIELQIDHKVESEGGFAQFQKDFIGDGDAPTFIYKVGRTSVYNGRTYEDFADIPETRLEKDRLFDLPSRAVDIDRGEVFPDFSGTRATVSYVDQIYIRTDNLTHATSTEPASPSAIRFKRKFNEWYDKVESELDRVPLENFRAMFKQWRDSDILTQPVSIREIVKNMYWHHLTPDAYKELVASAHNRVDLTEKAVTLLKYFNTMSTSGSKVRGSELFLRTINEIALRQELDNGFWWEGYDLQGRPVWDGVRDAIMDYTSRGRLNVVSIKDESVEGFNAKELVKKALAKQYATVGKGTKQEKAIIDLINKIDNGGFPSLNSSALNAQSWLGTTASHLSYLHKGRSLMDNLAGVKPVGWSPSSDILLKTNFIYDRDIADLLDAAKIDILTTESASKRFGAGAVDLGWKERRDVERRRIVEIRPTERRLEERRGDIPVGSYHEAFAASTDILSNAPKGRLQIEDLYFGKINERKMANVSYGVLDFIDKLGYDAFTKDYINYYQKLDAALGEVLTMRDPRDITRNEVFMNTHNIVRDNGEIFNDGSSGSLSRLVRAGMDVQQGLISAPAERMAVRRILGEISKVKTEHGSYSVLIPYLEGSIPVYGEGKDGRQTQLSFGGKKVSSFDGDVKIKDWDKVKFIAEWKDKNKDGYDIQVSTRGEEVTVNDPFLGNDISNSTKSAFKSYIKEVRKRLDRERGVGGATYKNLYDLMERLGDKTLPNGEKFKMYIHSLSLRIPNLAGDVAVHKIEGFLDRSLGNTTGINMFDLAVIHQADFDVDAVFNHHDMPVKVIDSVTKGLAKTPDAFVYEPDNTNIDIFNTGAEIGTVGKVDTDVLAGHYNNFRNSQKIFGSIMNLSNGLRALERLEFKFENGSMMDIDSPQFTSNKQRLKNVEQSIIDATKKSNFVSRATSEDVTKYILFGKSFKGSEIIDKNLQDYNEQKGETKEDYKWEGMFDLSKYEGLTKDVVQDAIMQSLSIINTQNRMLTGVNDAAGRRPPDLNQMMYIRNRLDRFLKRPNQTVFNDLLFRYRVLNKDRASDHVFPLINLFYNTKGNTYQDNKLFLKDLFKKGSKDQAIHVTRKPFLDLRKDPNIKEELIPDGEKNIHLTGVGGIIADKFGTHLNDESYRPKVASRADTRFAQDFIDKIESAHLLASSESLIEVNEFAETIRKVGDGDYTTGGKELFGDYGNVFFKDLKDANPSASLIQNYSIMYHELQKNERSLRNFVDSNKGSKQKATSVARAQYKLNLVGAAKDYLETRETELIDAARQKDATHAVKSYFHYQDYNLKKRKSGTYHRNETSKSQYIYRVAGKGDRIKYNYVGHADPKGGFKPHFWLKKGSEYVVLKNPVRYDLATQPEIKDAIALLRVTGDILAEQIDGINPNAIDGFYERVSSLKKDFYELNNETFKLVNKSAAFAQRNWMDAKTREDILIKDFFTNALNNTSQSTDALFAISALVIKPTPSEGLTRLTSDKEGLLAIPTFKINRRLTLAVERYINSRSNEPGVRDVYDSIFGEWGKYFRMSVNKVMHPAEEAMYRSDLLSTDPAIYADRDPLLDYVYGKPGYLYMPNVLQRVQRPLKRYGGKSFKAMDMEGNLRRVTSFDNIADFETPAQYYGSERNYRETIDVREVCR